ncbi:MAG: hypothetical protein IJE00_01245 [Clostridia bacterium]|nr:hypothetical protein [Clostridia bacterium]
MYSEETQKKQREYDAIVEPEKQQSAYDPLYQAAVKKYADRDEFSYNADEDPLFAQYKDSYTKQGRLAMEDTIGKASSMTGGYGNSFAQQAGQQTFNGYMSALNDKIPELYQLAAANYDRKVSGMLNDISVLGGAVDRDDARYQTALNNYYQKKNLVGNELSRLQSSDLSTAAAQAAAPSMSYEDIEMYAEKVAPLITGDGVEDAVWNYLIPYGDAGLISDEQASAIVSRAGTIANEQKKAAENAKKEAEETAKSQKQASIDNIAGWEHSGTKWEVSDYGGDNIFGGIDRDAELIDPKTRKKVKVENLFWSLKGKIGWSAAHKKIMELQEELGF